MEIIINRCYGGFHLSPEAVLLYAKYKGIVVNHFSEENLYTTLPLDEFRTLHLEYKKVIRSQKEYKKYSSSDNYHRYAQSLFYVDEAQRTDPVLIQVVKELGDKANSECSNLHIVEIPGDIEYEIHNYDGYESVHEKHRSWS